VAALRPLAEAAADEAGAGIAAAASGAARRGRRRLEAKLLAGGPADGAASEDECRPRWCWRPGRRWRLCREASFAPLLAVMPFGDMEGH
jgi:hypothetical protein